MRVRSGRTVQGGCHRALRRVPRTESVRDVEHGSGHAHVRNRPHSVALAIHRVRLAQDPDSGGQPAGEARDRCPSAVRVVRRGRWNEAQDNPSHQGALRQGLRRGYRHHCVSRQDGDLVQRRVVRRVALVCVVRHVRQPGLRESMLHLDPGRLCAHERQAHPASDQAHVRLGE